MPCIQQVTPRIGWLHEWWRGLSRNRPGAPYIPGHAHATQGDGKDSGPVWPRLRAAVALCHCSLPSCRILALPSPRRKLDFDGAQFRWPHESGCRLPYRLLHDDRSCKLMNHNDCDKHHPLNASVEIFCFLCAPSLPYSIVSTWFGPIQHPNQEVASMSAKVCLCDGRSCVQFR